MDLSKPRTPTEMEQMSTQRLVEYLKPWRKLKARKNFRNFEGYLLDSREIERMEFCHKHVEEIKNILAKREHVTRNK